MSVITTTIDIWESNRERTLSLLDTVCDQPGSGKALAWRPGPGRAHITWQLMHIAITEELFATERLLGTPTRFAEYAPRFRNGSVPDDEPLAADEIRRVLIESRQDLINTVSTFSDKDLETIPEPFRERGWTLGKVLQVLCWHEPHHQGQAHLTWNLWRAHN